MKNKKEIYKVLECIEQDDTYSVDEGLIDLEAIISPQITEFAQFYFEKQLEIYKQTGTVFNDASKLYLEFFYGK